jgi:hypothetical protein
MIEPGISATNTHIYEYSRSNNNLNYSSQNFCLQNQDQIDEQLKELDEYENKLRETNSQDLIQKIGDFDEFKSQYKINHDFENENGDNSNEILKKRYSKLKEKTKKTKKMRRTKDPYTNMNDK